MLRAPCAKIRDVLASHPADRAIVALHKYKHAPIGENVKTMSSTCMLQALYIYLVLLSIGIKHASIGEVMASQSTSILRALRR